MPELTQEFTTLPVDALEPHPDNPRRGDVDAIAESIDHNGFYGAIIAQRRADGSHRIIAGEHRWRGAQKQGMVEVPVMVLDVDDDAALRIMLVDNRATDLAGYDRAVLDSVLASLASGDLSGTGYDEASLSDVLASLDPGPSAAPSPPPPQPEQQVRRLLSERFVVPPFSVLDARQGYWRDRKAQWTALGIRSEEGRPSNLLKMSDAVLEAARPPNRSVPGSVSGGDPSFYWKKQEAERVAGRDLTTEEFLADWYESDAYIGGTSTFDPVVCELAYRWFSPPDGSVLDPFAGGSVRGIVAALLGRSYHGVELRPEQIAANVEQAERIVPAGSTPPAWIEGDATLLPKEAGASHDLVFSCPPYHDLERYSEDPRDLSNMPWDEFLAAYREAIRQAVDRLADDRFAVWVIGEIRAPDGTHRGLVPATVDAFSAAGADFYNEATLVTPGGSLALRAARVFLPNRKLARSHQAVLVFVKGDAKAAAEACGDLSDLDLTLPDPEGPDPE